MYKQAREKYEHGIGSYRITTLIRLSFLLLLQVCADLGIICETDYFGLIPVRDGDSVADVDEGTAKQWINLRNPLHLYTNDRTHPIVFSLRVKFWVPAHLILQGSVRSLFFMQARQELFDGHLRPSSWANAAYLAALLLQADGYKYDPAKVPSTSEMLPNGAASVPSSLERRPAAQGLRRPSKRGVYCGSLARNVGVECWYCCEVGCGGIGFLFYPCTPTLSSNVNFLCRAAGSSKMYFFRYCPPLLS